MGADLVLLEFRLCWLGERMRHSRLLSHHQCHLRPVDGQLTNLSSEQSCCAAHSQAMETVGVWPLELGAKPPKPHRPWPCCDPSCK